MKGPHTGRPGEDWHLGEGPFYFSGTPGQCLGEVRLINSSDDKVKVRLLPTRAPSRKRKGCTPLTEARLVLQARIPPHEAVQARAQLLLDPQTPPGLYETTLVCGSQKTVAQVEIQPERGLSIEPTHLRVRGISGDTISHPLRLRNLGNVPISLGDVAMIWLRERNWIGRTLVYCLREVHPEESYEDFANRVLHSLRDSMVSPVRIDLEPTLAEIAPGQQLERVLSLTLPHNIQKGRQYLGFIKINEYRIWMELYCNGAQGSSKRR